MCSPVASPTPNGPIVARNPYSNPIAAPFVSLAILTTKAACKIFGDTPSNRAFGEEWTVFAKRASTPVAVANLVAPGIGWAVADSHRAALLQDQMMVQEKIAAAEGSEDFFALLEAHLQAITLGNTRSMIIMGKTYCQEGKITEGLALIREAAALGHPAAGEVFYRLTLGMPEENQQALELLIASAEAHYVPSIEWLIILFEEDASKKVYWTAKLEKVTAEKKGIPYEALPAIVQRTHPHGRKGSLPSYDEVPPRQSKTDDGKWEQLPSLLESMIFPGGATTNQQPRT